MSEHVSEVDFGFLATAFENQSNSKKAYSENARLIHSKKTDEQLIYSALWLNYQFDHYPKLPTLPILIIDDYLFLLQKYLSNYCEHINRFHTSLSEIVNNADKPHVKGDLAPVVTKINEQIRTLSNNIELTLGEGDVRNGRLKLSMFERFIKSSAHPNELKGFSRIFRPWSQMMAYIFPNPVRVLQLKLAYKRIDSFKPSVQKNLADLSQLQETLKPYARNKKIDFNWINFFARKENLTEPKLSDTNATQTLSQLIDLKGFTPISTIDEPNMTQESLFPKFNRKKKIANDASNNVPSLKQIDQPIHCIIDIGRALAEHVGSEGRLNDIQNYYSKLFGYFENDESMRVFKNTFHSELATEKLKDIINAYSTGIFSFLNAEEKQTWFDYGVRFLQNVTRPDLKNAFGNSDELVKQAFILTQHEIEVEMKRIVSEKQNKPDEKPTEPLDLPKIETTVVTSVQATNEISDSWQGPFAMFGLYLKGYLENREINSTTEAEVKSHYFACRKSLVGLKECDFLNYADTLKIESRKINLHRAWRLHCEFVNQSDFAYSDEAKFKIALSRTYNNFCVKSVHDLEKKPLSICNAIDLKIRLGLSLEKFCSNEDYAMYLFDQEPKRAQLDTNQKAVYFYKASSWLRDDYWRAVIIDGLGQEAEFLDVNSEELKSDLDRWFETSKKFKVDLNALGEMQKLEVQAMCTARSISPQFKKIYNDIISKQKIENANYLDHTQAKTVNNNSNELRDHFAKGYFDSFNDSIDSVSIDKYHGLGNGIFLEMDIDRGKNNSSLNFFSTLIPSEPKSLNAEDLKIIYQRHNTSDSKTFSILNM